MVNKKHAAGYMGKHRRAHMAERQNFIKARQNLCQTNRLHC